MHLWISTKSNEALSRGFLTSRSQKKSSSGGRGATEHSGMNLERFTLASFALNQDVDPTILRSPLAVLSVESGFS